MTSRDVDAELERWVEKLRQMEPHSKRIGELAELDRLLDKLDGQEASRWYDEHSDDINRVLIPMTRSTNDGDAEAGS